MPAIHGTEEEFHTRNYQKHVEARLRYIQGKLREKLLRIAGPLPDDVWEPIALDLLGLGQWVMAQEAKRTLKAKEETLIVTPPPMVTL